MSASDNKAELKEVGAFTGHTGSVTCLVVLDSCRIISGSFDSTLKLWKASTRECIGTFVGHTLRITCVASLTKGRIVSSSEDKTVKIWRVDTRICLQTIVEHMLYCCGLGSFNNGRFLGRSADGALKLWDASTNDCIKKFGTSIDLINCIASLKDELVVTGSLLSNLKIWDINQGICVATILGHVKSVTCVITIDQIKIVSGSDDCTIKIWSSHPAAEARCILTISGHSKSVTSVAQLSGGRILSGSADDTVKVWNIDTGECLLSQSCACPNGLAVVDDFRLISVSRGGDDNMISWIEFAAASRMVRLRNGGTDTALVKELLQCLCESINLDDKSASIVALCKHWESISGYSYFKEYVSSMFPSLPLCWFDVQYALVSGQLRHQDVFSAQLSNDTTIHALLKEQDVFGTHFPTTCYDAWVNIAGCAIDAPAEFDNSTLQALSRLCNCGEAETVDKSKSQDIKFHFELCSSSILISKSDNNECCAEFKGKSQSENAVSLTPSLAYPDEYKLSFSFQGIKAKGVSINIVDSDRTILLQITITTNRKATFLIALKDSNEEILGSFTCPVADITLNLNLLVGHVTVHATDQLALSTSAFIDTGEHSVHLEIISLVKGASVQINKGAVTSNVSQAFEEYAPSVHTESVTESALPQSAARLLAQAKMLWNLLCIKSDMNLDELDQIVSAAIESFHSCVLLIKLHNTTSMLHRIVSSGLQRSALAVILKSLPIQISSMASDISGLQTSCALEPVASKLTSLGVADVVDMWDKDVEKEKLDAWMANAAKKTLNIFELNGCDTEQCLLLALAVSSPPYSMLSLGRDVLHKYTTSCAGAKMNRLVKLCETRLFILESNFDAARTSLELYILLGWYHILKHPKTSLSPDYLLTDKERRLLVQQSTSKSSRDLQFVSKPLLVQKVKTPAEDWIAFKDALKKRNAKSFPAMEELMQLVAMDEIKHHALQLFMMMETYAQLPSVSQVPVRTNFAFLGNPGTGKTTVARIFGKLLHEIGARRSDIFIEKPAASLKREGVVGMAATVKQALGGVLFIDDAHKLGGVFSTDAIDELLSIAETHRNDITIIIAGGKEEVENKMFCNHPGMVTRFNSVVFNDFDENQLCKVWDIFLKKHAWTVQDQNVSTVVMRRIARQRGRKGFRNAHAVCTYFETAIKAAAMRYALDQSTPKQTITMEDILGKPPSRDRIPELDSALRDLECLSGLDEVKTSIYQMVEVVAENYNRELCGQPILELTLNRLMLGNPGTGKTTVASIYGRVLKSLGLVSKGSVEYRVASNFTGMHVGESVVKTVAILELCQGKVLVIDEAFNLDDDKFGKDALDTIVENVTGLPGEDIAILMLGYDKEMRKMLRQQNPGLARRFNLESALVFHDYDDVTLANIASKMCAAENIQVSYDVMCCIVRTLSRLRDQQNFGNAGAVRNLLSLAKTRMMSRISKSGGSWFKNESNALQISDIVGENRDAFGGLASDQDILAPLRSMHAAESIIESIESLQRFLVVRRREGKDVSAAAGNWLFLGNPGTGKTTVAKCMGRLLKDLGVLSRDHVEITSAVNLTGEYSGQTKVVVEEAMKRACGGVLFIDEAYELGRGKFSKEAMTKLVELLTMDEYSRGTVVVMAGYDESMQTMLKRNPGLASRFQRTLHFPDWTAEDACDFVLEQMRSDGYQVGAGVSSALLSAFEELRTRPGWANARDATSAWRDRIQFERTKRVYEVEEATPTVLLEDVQSGMASLLAARPKGTMVNRRETIESYDGY